MNKFFLFLIFTFLIVGCEPAKVESTFTLELFNNMDSDIFVDVLLYQEACGDTVTINLAPKSNHSFYCSKESIVRERGISANYDIFNIHDTSLLKINSIDLSSVYMKIFLDARDTLLSKYITVSGGNTDNSGSTEEVVITLTDEFFGLAEKDYTMLEKFPEYYGKQE